MSILNVFSWTGGGNIPKVRGEERGSCGQSTWSSYFLITQSLHCPIFHWLWQNLCNCSNIVSWTHGRYPNVYNLEKLSFPYIGLMILHPLQRTEASWFICSRLAKFGGAEHMTAIEMRVVTFPLHPLCTGTSLITI